MKTFKKFMRSRSGVTMPELLIAMVIAAVLLLTVGVLSQISLSSQRRASEELQANADLSYGLKLMRIHIREHGYGTDTPGGLWNGPRILVQNGAFGIYQDAGTKAFVYVPDYVNNPSDMQILVSVPSTDTLNMTLSNMTPPYTITVKIDGETNQIPFEMSMTVTKRG